MKIVAFWRHFCLSGFQNVALSKRVKWAWYYAKNYQGKLGKELNKQLGEVVKKRKENKKN